MSLKQAISFFLAVCLLTGCGKGLIHSEEGSSSVIIERVSDADVSRIPAYDGIPYVILNDNQPVFKEEEFTETAFENYSPLDELGRCGPAFANICKDIMPAGEREPLGNIKPTGWHTVKYSDLIEDRYLYNRCHLIGYQLAGENGNELNLITGTRYFNIQGMFPFENLAASYVRKTKNHVLYRVTPVFEGDNLVASGVVMEAESVEDKGSGVCFCVYVYNVQPGVQIDYATGYSQRDPDYVPAETAYRLDVQARRFHYPYCPDLIGAADDMEDYSGDRDKIIQQGYSSCWICRP